MIPQERTDEKIWSCTKCSLPLEMAKVPISYLGNEFPVDLLRCPGCGLVFIPEDLALGKIAEVEKLLEDK
ncbi:MAG: DVU_1557 family redox protein [Syntrophobacteraceae bacterium]